MNTTSTVGETQKTAKNQNFRKNPSSPSLPFDEAEFTPAPNMETQAKDDDISIAKPEAPHNKDQLRRRVEARLVELELALSQLEGGKSNNERCNAISTALQAVKNDAESGWDKVGEVEAAHLSRWLEQTEYLTVSGPTPSDSLAPDASKDDMNLEGPRGDTNIETSKNDDADERSIEDVGNRKA